LKGRPKHTMLIDESSDIEFSKSLELKMFVVWTIGRRIPENHLLLIEEAFLDKWNNSVGQILGDGDCKNHVYRYIESKDPIVFPSQELVDQAVDQMLEYMERIGEWS